VIVKASLSLFAISAGALGLAQYLPTLLDYYYAVLVAVAFIYGARTSSFAYTGMMVLLMTVYAIENNSHVWQIDVYVLTAVYFVAAWLVLVFQTDDGLEISRIIAGIIAIKFLVSFNMDPSYWSHTLLNFLSIAQWAVYIALASERIRLNKGYTKDENPFMLRVALTWNQFRTRYATTKSA